MIGFKKHLQMLCQDNGQTYEQDIVYLTLAIDHLDDPHIGFYGMVPIWMVDTLTMTDACQNLKNKKDPQGCQSNDIQMRTT